MIGIKRVFNSLNEYSDIYIYIYIYIYIVAITEHLRLYIDATY